MNKETLAEAEKLVIAYGNASFDCAEHDADEGYEEVYQRLVVAKQELMDFLEALP